MILLSYLVFVLFFSAALIGSATGFVKVKKVFWEFAVPLQVFFGWLFHWNFVSNSLSDLPVVTIYCFSVTLTASFLLFYQVEYPGSDEADSREPASKGAQLAPPARE